MVARVALLLVVIACGTPSAPPSKPPLEKPSSFATLPPDAPPVSTVVVDAAPARRPFTVARLERYEHDGKLIDRARIEGDNPDDEIDIMDIARTDSGRLVMSSAARRSPASLLLPRRNPSPTTAKASS